MNYAFLGRVTVGNRTIGEEGKQRIIQLELTLVGGDRDQGGHYTLGYRGLIVDSLAVIGVEVGVEQQFAIAHKQ